MARINWADDVDRTSLEHIRRYGWEKILVGGGHCHSCHEEHADGHGGPVYAYTIGLSLTYQHAELLISAPTDLALALLDHAVQRLQQGSPLTPGTLYGGFFAQQSWQVCPLKPVKKDLLGQAINILHTRDFAALQLVYPDQQGHWPWMAVCAASVRRVQKVYCYVSQAPRQQED